MKYYFTIILIVMSMSSWAQRLSVMSYNIHIGQNSQNDDKLLEIAKFINSSNVDLVGLQEVDSVCNRSGNIDQMKFLAEKTGMFYSYASHFPFDGGSYGIGILTRWPIKSIQNNRISVNIGDQIETRALLSINLIYRNKEFTFSTVHMDYRNRESRIRQAEEIINIYSLISNPVILTGDFNAQPETQELAILERLFIDISKESGFTYPAINPKAKIDYVLLTKNLLHNRIKNKKVPIDFSDHRPVLTVFNLK